MQILPDDYIDPELQDLVGGSSMTEVTKSLKNALSLNIDEGDLNTPLFRARDGFSGETEIADLLEKLIRRRIARAFQYGLPRS